MKAAGSKNRSLRRLGKAQVREEFSPLVESIATGAGAIEITDYGKVVAVLLSEKEYKWLTAASEKNVLSKSKLRGSMTLLGDLEEASKELTTDFEASLKRTAGQL